MDWIPFPLGLNSLKPNAERNPCPEEVVGEIPTTLERKSRSTRNLRGQATRRAGPHRARLNPIVPLRKNLDHESVIVLTVCDCVKLSMSSIYTPFFRYAVLAVVIVLLAPYAGCHIFTSPPLDPLDAAHKQPRLSSSSLNPPDVVDNASGDRDTQRQADHLEDIQELLSR
jgi:hypothetical protein